MRSPDIFQRIKENQFLCDLHPANIGQEATALKHRSPFTPCSLGVSLLTGVSAFIVGSQEISDDSSPAQHQHLCSSAWHFSFQSLHSHHEYSATWSWMVLLMWPFPSARALRQEALLLDHYCLVLLTSTRGWSHQIHGERPESIT